MKTKYIPQENADKILKLLTMAQEQNQTIGFWLRSDDGETSVKSRNPEKILSEMDGVDDNFGINFMGKTVPESDARECLGWIYLTPYEEEDCVICNYSDNEFCEKLIASVEA